MKKIIFEKSIVKRAEPLNFIPSDDHIFKRYWTSNRPECHILNLKNVYIVNKTIVSPRNLTIFERYSHVNGIRFLGKLKTIFKFLFTSKKRNIGRAVWIHDNFSNNYYHWLTECLPRYLFAQGEIKDHVVLVPEKFKRYSFIIESLNLLGIEFTFFNQNESVLVSELVLTSLIGRVAEYRPELLFLLRNKFNVPDLATQVPPKMIYIRRKPAKARNILNESEVVKVMDEYNIESHFFEEYSLKEQMEIMNKTVFLVSIHGAGLTNMLFMPQNSFILEFRNEFDEGYSPSCYFNLASELGLNYYYTTNKGTAPKTNQADYEIDIIKLKVALNEICSKIKSNYNM
jgi:capsular polysaccharide biosynthesis protein